MPTTTPAKPGARERLLAAADELFYAEGVQTVGIDRVIERAGVAKASLYNTFGSKDALVKAYLEGRHDRIRTRVERRLSGLSDPVARIEAVFAVQAERYAEPSYRGCAFANASAEAPAGSGADTATRAYRDWLRDLFTDLARDAGAARPAELGRQLQLVYDGFGYAGRMDHDAAGRRAVVATVRTLVAAALG